MPVKVKCSGCSTVLKAPDRARGKAVKCPKCGKGIRVPAQSASRPKQRASRQSVDDDDFLGGMDLGHFEDRTARVCPKCGATVGDEDVDCPSCGADLATGGLGVTQRARAKRKGAAPSEYYSAAFKDAGSYLMKKLGLVWKTILILTIFPILAQICFDFIVWCHNWPPRAFWLFVSLVCTLITPGWVWYVQHQFVLRILEPKRERYPVRVETFSAVSLGIKAVAWSLFFGLPVWIVFGGIGGLLAMTGSTAAAVMTILAGVLLFYFLVLISWPIVQAHFAMPITWPGWMIHKVLPDVGRNIGPSLYAAAIVFALYLPVLGVTVGTTMFTLPYHNELQTTLAAHSRVNRANEAIAYAEENTEEPPPEAAEIAKQEPPAINWGLYMWPMAGQIPIAIVFSFWMVFSARMAAYFVKLFRANIENLITHEKDYVYTPLSPLEQEALERERGPLNANSVKTFALLGVVFAALGGVGMAMTIGKEEGYIASFGVAFAMVGSLLNTIASLLILLKAFRTSAMWGLALLVPFVNTIAFFVFIAKESKRTIYDFQLWLFSAAFYLIAGILMGVWIAMGIWAAAAKAAAEAEEAEQALRLVEMVTSFLC